jgi:antitoxin component YwqK of YwqJK toxin-antitoxin module
MLQFLNNNILKYILNSYLNYEEDVISLIKLFPIKFSLKLHLSTEIKYYKHTQKQIAILLDNKVIQERSYNNKKKIFRLNNYKNEEKHGIQKYWYDTGILYSEVYYENGKNHGTEKLWYINGNLKQETNYMNGKKNGFFTFQNFSGDIEHKYFYKNDILIEKIY